jgi:hypothetical protein
MIQTILMALIASGVISHESIKHLPEFDVDKLLSLQEGERPNVIMIKMPITTLVISLYPSGEIGVMKSTNTPNDIVEKIEKQTDVKHQSKHVFRLPINPDKNVN